MNDESVAAAKIFRIRQMVNGPGTPAAIGYFGAAIVQLEPSVMRGISDRAVVLDDKTREFIVLSEAIRSIGLVDRPEFL